MNPSLLLFAMCNHSRGQFYKILKEGERWSTVKGFEASVYESERTNEDLWNWLYVYPEALYECQRMSGFYECMFSPPRLMKWLYKVARLKVVVGFCCWVRWAAGACSTTQRRWQNRPGESQNGWKNSTESTSGTSTTAVIIRASAWATAWATAWQWAQWPCWTSKNSAAQRTELLCNGWDFRRDDAGDESLEAWNRLRCYNVVLLVLLDVAFVQLINESGFCVDELINFLQQKYLYNINSIQRQNYT